MKNSKDLGVYSLVLDERGHEHWVEIGYATRHHDGEGFDLTVRALPLASRLVLREAASDDSQVECQNESQESFHKEPKDLATLSLASQVRDFERAVIRQCLLETGGNIAAVLERLKIPRRTLNEKMVRLGINRRGLKPVRQRIAANAADVNPESDGAVVPGEPSLIPEQPHWSKNGASNGQ